MKKSLRYELDNLFSINKLGEVYAENPVSADIWQTDKHDYVTIVVPDLLSDRFRAFWESAKMKMPELLVTYHIQDGTAFGDLMIREVWYFVTVECAEALLERFHEILPYSLPKAH